MKQMKICFQAVEDLVTNIRPQESGEMKSKQWRLREGLNGKHLKSKAEKIYSGFKQFDEWAMLWRGWLSISCREAFGRENSKGITNLPTVLQKQSRRWVCPLFQPRNGCE
ncbi:hypothetical protein P7H22_26095 [Paenibacillus larvae]|nr:hypothetical protein [Paenibacillus larvae]MDT2243105.1 hypothetical protein [Paenibacillus larvae]